MSASFDTELIRKAGEVTGIEARVVSQRRPGHRGLSRWAPTVDLERDPRWGRNEEGYGEDAMLTGAMAGNYIRGMRGDDPYYIRCAATLKHFYGNNTENGRGFKNSSMPPRDREEFYLEPFRRCIEAGAEGVMTAYNRINGIPGILNPEVTTILKKRFGLTHVVGDGGAMQLVMNIHRYYGSDSQSVARALKAGVDGMSDNPAVVNEAVEEAYALGLITEEDLDRSIRNTMRLKLRLGVYDKDQGTPGSRNPYDHYTEADILTDASMKVEEALSREAVVLLKNNGDTLPLDAENCFAGKADACTASDGKTGAGRKHRLALAGPVADVWFQDWYGGEAPCHVTLRDGIRKVMEREAAEAVPCRTAAAGSATGAVTNIPYASGNDIVAFSVQTADGGKRPLVLAADGTVRLGAAGAEAAHFELEDWGSGHVTFRSVDTGKYMNARFYNGDTQESGILACEKDRLFDWFVMETFHLIPRAGGGLTLQNRFHLPFYVKGDQLKVYADSSETPEENAAPAALFMDVALDGIAAAVKAAEGADTVITALGCCPMINAKEEIDRETIDLPPHQEALVRALTAAGKKVVLVLLSNYPYALHGFEKDPAVPAILWSATGAQDMGAAVADTLFGFSAPAGRTNQTWYAADWDIPDINEYGILKARRTYRLYRGKTLYPFGWGLNYTSFDYTDFSLACREEVKAAAEDAGNAGCSPNPHTVEETAMQQKLTFHVTLTNTGKRASDKVVTIYGIPALAGLHAVNPVLPEVPDVQLVGFARVHDVQPGESREVVIEADPSEFAIYDTIQEKKLIPAGTYRFAVMESAEQAAGGVNPVTIELGDTNLAAERRDVRKRTRADHFDDYDGAELVEGAFGYTGVRVLKNADRAELTFTRMGDISGAQALEIMVKSDGEGKVTAAFTDGTPHVIAAFRGSTTNYVVPAKFRENSIKEGDPQPKEWPAQWLRVRLPITERPAGDGWTMHLTVEGAAELLYWRFV